MSAPVAPHTPSPLPRPEQAELDLACAGLNQTGPADQPSPTSQTGLLVLVLVGAGYAHLHVLASLAQRPLQGVRVILVSPGPHQIHAAMLPGFVAGHYALDDCVIPLEPLVRHANVRWLARQVKALDASQHLLTMDDSSTLAYDWLSINTGAIQNRELLELSMPGARTHGLFVRPLDAFVTLWPRVVEMGATRALRIAVIGAGATGVELAFAVRRRLPNAAVTLVAGPHAPGANYAPPVQQRLRKLLKKRGITVLKDTATSIEAHQVHLGCGASLACDVPLLATSVQPPAWLAGSGLELDAQGFIAVNAYQQSINHPHVFATGDISTRSDQALARNGVYALRAGPALLSNLHAATTGVALNAYSPPEGTLNLLSCGGRYALASWGKYSAQGHWVWWLKNWIDRRFVAKHTRGGL